MEIVKKKSWWQKLFPATETEYVGTAIYERKWIWSDKVWEQEVAVYRTFNKETNKTVSLYATIPNQGKKYFDPNAWDADQKLISI